jgi:hypothetical protein
MPRNDPDRQLAALSIEAMAELTLAVRQLGDGQQVAAQRQADLDAAVRYIKPAPQRVTVGSGGTAIADMDGPKTGFQWSVRGVTVTDAASVASTVAGSAYIYAGQPSPLLATPENSEWSMQTLPNWASFGPGELVLQYGEHLLVQVAGATAAQVLIVSARYQLYTPALWSATRVVL